MVYQYKTGAQIKVPAQIAGAVCQELYQSGGLTAKRLLDASRDENAPLHGEFEWDDSVAAENYRESQAAYIIRNIEVKTVESENSPVRAFVSIKEEQRSYVSIETVIRNEDMMSQMLKRALKELSAFQIKYSALSALTPVFEAAEVVRKGA